MILSVFETGQSSKYIYQSFTGTSCQAEGGAEEVEGDGGQGCWQGSSLRRWNQEIWKEIETR